MNPIFVVLEFNQASRQPDGQHVELWDDLDDALTHMDYLTEENRRDGRRETYRVFELVEVEP